MLRLLPLQVHYDARIGTSRTTSDDADSPALREARERRTRRAAVLRSQSMSAGGAGVQLAFQPMTVAFRDLHYRCETRLTPCC